MSNKNKATWGSDVAAAYSADRRTFEQERSRMAIPDQREVRLQRVGSWATDVSGVEFAAPRISDAAATITGTHEIDPAVIIAMHVSQGMEASDG